MNSQRQPEESDNFTNTMTEHHVESAIEMGLQSRQETYREFMDSFLFLTDEDVKKYEEAKLKKEMEKLALETHEEQRKTEASNTSDKDNTLPKGKVPAALKIDKRSPASDEELETEEIGEGTYSPRCTDADKFGGGKKFVQVDNFVEDDSSTSSTASDDSDEDDIIDYGVAGGGYVSSFGHMDVDASNHDDYVDVEDEERTSVTNEDIDADEEEQRMISPLPGEAEDNPTDAEIHVHETQLEISTKRLSDCIDAASSDLNESEESTNEVQPFSLDENFDYDNVVLSQKWDMNERPPNLPT